jgi:hypothetical protein
MRYSYPANRQDVLGVQLQRHLPPLFHAIAADFAVQGLLTATR